MVRVICPNLKCRTILSAPETARGKMVRCSACGMKVRIPEGGPRPDPSSVTADEAKTTGKA